MKLSAYNILVDQGETLRIYNSLSGSLVQMSPETYASLVRFVEHGEAATLPYDLLSQLARASMIVNDGDGELDLIRKRYAATRYAKHRVTLSIVTTMNCNFDCAYCFEDKYAAKLSPAVLSGLDPFLERYLAGVRQLHVVWFGGEPLLALDRIQEASEIVARQCDNLGIDYSGELTTNGVLLTERALGILKRCKVKMVQIGLDGPPSVHDALRPYKDGRGSFWPILENIKRAAEQLEVIVRVNLDKNNVTQVEELFQILADHGLANKVALYPAQIFQINDGRKTPSACYSGPCYSTKEFAEVELAFKNLARQYGLAKPPILPVPSGAPCTAVRANDLVIGSDGELYKCLQTVGNPEEVVGHLDSWPTFGPKMNRWLDFDPTADSECLGCRVLPTCMGGCAQNAGSPAQYGNRCSPFRYSGYEQILHFEEAGSASWPTGISGPEDLAYSVEVR